MKHRLSILGIVLFWSFLAAPLLRAQDGLAGALSAVGSASHSASEAGAPLVAADFDNDQKSDAAILREAGLLNGERAFRIELHLTADKNDAITFSSVESGLSISALDVDRDGVPDIVIEKAFTHERVEVYLNDGHGTFHRARIEDYPSSNPSAPYWRAQSNQNLPIFCLPASRTLEIGSLQRISMLDRSSSRQLSFWPEALLLQSGPRAPSTPRAPPSLLSF